MTNLRRNKRILYLCNQKEENDRIIYTEPKKMKLNYLPLSTTGEIIAFGNEFIDRLVIYTTPKISKDFHNADRCYIFKEKPKEYDKFCSTADFYVDGEPLVYLNEATIYLTRMTGDRYGN